MSRALLNRFLAPLCLLLALAACQTLPYANDRTVPPVVEVSDGSAQRAALNARTYDAAIGWVSRRFYRRDFGGIDWLAEAAARRQAAVEQPDEAGFYRVLNATLALLDDAHTRAVTPTRYRQRLRERREARPLMGFSMRVIDGQFIVTRVRPDAPAAGRVHVGWRLDSIDGTPVTTALSSERRPEHEVVFTDADGVEHALTLPEVNLPPLPGEMIQRSDGVVVLTFASFTSASRSWLNDRMREIAADPPPGLIVDLRDNGGGLLAAVGAALSPFFTEPQPYAYVQTGYMPRWPYRTRPWRQGYAGPVAVLTSGVSASGAEVFAATMQETGRGQVFGAKTRGAVIASRQLVLPDGGELSIGIRAFRSGQGQVLEGEGVTPDHAVEVSADELHRGRDAVIEAAAAAVLANGPVRP